ncbi:MAG: TIGR04283 family arsenosugar biosynthesis glycosyltransferase [Desulfobulbaceae bacterium]|nr:TIGR04283 family arsenosugar biosynthesis glycosyltransferase [Desulfobulbaceae bacterium]
MNISIIIPTLNEEKTLGRLLCTLKAYAGLELLVADGGSDDRTLEIAQYYGAKTVSSGPGRGRQQNRGAEAATGDILLFLHSDTLLPAEFSGYIYSLLSLPGTAGGAFRLKIDAPGAGYRVIEWGANLRSSLFQLIYGDQAIFVSRKLFFQAGGFPDQAILEDVELVRRLNKFGKIRLAPAVATTSARRWLKLGLVRTTLLNQMMLAGYLLNVDPEKLNHLYYKKYNR